MTSLDLLDYAHPQQALEPDASLINWSAIEAEFCEGSASVRDIARRYRVSEGAIRKHARVRSLVRTKVRSGAQGTQPAQCVPANQTANLSSPCPELIAQWETLELPWLSEAIEADADPHRNRIAQAGAPELWAILSDIERTNEMLSELWLAINEANERVNPGGLGDNATLEEINDCQHSLLEFKCAIFNRVMSERTVAVDFFRIKFGAAGGHR